MVQKYIIDKTDLPKLIRGEELALAPGNKYRAFCIEINEKLTNGDVIKAMFPHYDIEVNEQKNYVHIFYDSFYTTYPLRWWLEPYKADNTRDCKNCKHYKKHEGPEWGPVEGIYGCESWECSFERKDDGGAETL